MFRQNRSKTQPTEEILELGERASWSLIARSKSTPKNRGEGKSDFKLPKLKKIELNQKQKQFVNLRVIQMKKMGYDPIGCSKSIKLQKVRLRKRLDHNPFFESNKKQLVE